MTNNIIQMLIINERYSKEEANEYFKQCCKELLGVDLKEWTYEDIDLWMYEKFGLGYGYWGDVIKYLDYLEILEEI